MGWRKGISIGSGVALCEMYRLIVMGTATQHHVGTPISDHASIVFFLAIFPS
jgi:hypothetical protein